MPDIQERDLIARSVASRDVAAFGELVRRHQSALRNLLRKLTGDAALADDLAQESLLHAWGKLHTFAGRGSFVGWLLRIGYTKFLQSRRQSRRCREATAEAGQQSRPEPVARSAEHAADAETLLALLKPQERDIVILSYACGMSHREIGEATGVPVGTVKSIICRSKDKIRKRHDLKERLNA